MSEDFEEMKAGSPLFTYSNRYRRNIGIIGALVGMVSGVLEDRRQIWVAIKRNLKSAYSNTMLGMGWSVIMPLVPISAYAVLGLLFGRTNSAMPYLLYVSIGFTVFSLISWPIAGTLTSLRSEAGLLARSDIRMTTVILSAYGQQIWDNGIRIIVVLLGMAYFQSPIHIASLLSIMIIIPAVLFSMGIGGIAALLYVVAKDVGNIVTVGMRYLVFFSAVIFPMPQIPLVQKWIVVNPIYTYVNEARSLIVFGEFQKPEVLAWTIGASVLLFIVVNTIFYRLEARIRTYF